MQGAGNDFIVIDAVAINLKKLAVRACDRKTGIGADGLLVLGKSKKADYKMRIINADGSEAEMCGNGARCMAAYVARIKKSKKKTFTMETLAGIVTACVAGQSIEVRLSDPKNYRPNITVEVNTWPVRVDYIDTGVPHAVVFVDNLKAMAVDAIGRVIRYHKKFSPRGTNVNFVEQIGRDYIAIRTYERGIEAETRACGTGSVAAAIAAYRKAHPSVHDAKRATMKVLTASGEILYISFCLNNAIVSDVRLKGGATVIAKGEYYV